MKYVSWVRSLKPEAITGNTSRRTSELEQEGPQGTVGEATVLVQVSISSQGRVLMLDSMPYLLKSATWTADLSPLLLSTGYCWNAVEMSAQQVGVPSTKRRFVACFRNHPSAEERLIRWEARLANMMVQPVALAEFIGHKGSFFLNREQGEQGIVSFEDPFLSLTRSHILEEKSPASEYQPHPSDENSLRAGPGKNYLRC